MTRLFQVVGLTLFCSACATYPQYTVIIRSPMRDMPLRSGPVLQLEDAKATALNKPYLDYIKNNPPEAPLSAAYSAYLERDHLKAIAALNKYLAQATYDQDHPQDLLALEARINSLAPLRESKAYDKPYFADLTRYIGVLKKRLSANSIVNSLEREKLAELQLRLGRFYIESDKMNLVPALFQEILVELNGSESAQAQQYRYQAYLRWAREVMASQGKFHDAIEMLKLAENETGGDQSVLANLRFYQGFYYYLNHEYSEALSLFEANRDLFQKNKEYQSRSAYWKARILESLQRSREAREIYAKLVSDSPLLYYAQLAYLRLPEKPAFIFDAKLAPESIVFPTPKSWRAAHLKEKPLLLAETEDLLAEEKIPEARQLLDEAAEKYRPEPDEKNYVLYMADLLTKARAHIKAFELLNAFFPPETQKLNNPSLSFNYPRPFLVYFEDYSEKYAFDTELLLALSRQEAAFEERIISFDFGYGLLQVQAETGEIIAKELKFPHFLKEDLLEADTNIRFSSYYLKEALDAYKGNIAKSVAAYNVGRPIVDIWDKYRKRADLEEFIEDIPYEGTNRHVRNILKNRMNYFLIYKKRAPDHYFTP